MQQVKEISLRTIEKMSENSTFEDIMYQLHVVSKIFDGLNDVKNGQIISTDELLKKVDEWVISTN
jgi:predicted transcriptional regulator